MKNWEKYEKEIKALGIGNLAVDKNGKIGDCREMEYARYIELKQWDVIAREMGLNSRWIFETHNRALEKVYEKIKLVI